jgi:hypothetical protein
MSTYILDEDDEPEVCDDILVWSAWMSLRERRLLYDVVGDAEVSTVFLGTDYRHLGDGPPILWETMIFGGVHDLRITRYTSKLAALQGHARIVGALERERSAQSRHGHVHDAKGAHQHQHDD